MADFKLTIADPTSGKSYQKEVKDQEAAGFIGLNIGETIKGDAFGFGGYEFAITGGSDYCGFPMRRGILGVRKQLSLFGGVGYRGKGRFKIKRKGMKKRKTICGHKINAQISQINIKVTKAGTQKIEEMFGKAEGEAPKEKKAEAKEEKPKEEKTAAKAEAKPEKAAKEQPKEEAKPEAKEGKQEAKPKEADAAAEEKAA